MGNLFLICRVYSWLSEAYLLIRNINLTNKKSITDLINFINQF